MIKIMSCLAFACLAASALAQNASPAASQDWPQFRGPNGDCVAPSSPTLLDKWPSGGPPLVWKSDSLPFGPTCGVGTPVVAGGNVFTFAQISLPISGIKPFNAEFLLRWGWVSEMPEELRAKIEAALKDPKYAEVKTNPDQVEAYAQTFTGTLDPAQAKQFGDAIRNRFKLAHWWSKDDLAWMASFKDKDITSRQDFLNLFIDRFHHGIYHGPQAGELYKYADQAYKDQKWADMLYCLDGATGKLLWSKQLPGAKKAWGVEFGCSGVPTVVKDRVYFAGSGGVYCLDLKKKGELVWQGKGAASHTSPLVADGVVYCCPGELAAFNAETGAELWRQPTATGECSSPVLWKNGGKSYVICSSAAPRYSFNIYCVDAQNGKIVWRQNSLGEHTALVLQGDTLIARGNGGCAAYHLTPEKPEVLWTSKEGGDYGGSPVIYKDHMYNCGQAYGSNLVTVLDLKTGALKYKHTQKGGACSTGLVADGKILFVCESDYKTGRLISFQANPEKYEEVGQLPTKDLVASTSPAFANGRVYVRMPTAIACYDLTDRQK